MWGVGESAVTRTSLLIRLSFGTSLLLLKLRHKSTLERRASLLLVKSMNLVLSGWRASLRKRKQSTIFLNSALTLEISCSRLGPDRYKVVSSAKRRAISSEHRGRSFIYIKNSNGPRIDPWGIPIRMLSKVLFEPLTWTSYLRFVR